MYKEELITDEILTKVFGKADFGTTSLEKKKEVLMKALKNRAIGYHTGSTITHIMISLGLLQYSEIRDDDYDMVKIYYLTQKGFDYLITNMKKEEGKDNCDHRLRYDNGMVERYNIYCPLCDTNLLEKQ